MTMRVESTAVLRLSKSCYGLLLVYVYFLGFLSYWEKHEYLIG